MANILSGFVCDRRILDLSYYNPAVFKIIGLDDEAY
jgi:hypothetical protein